MKAVFVIDVDVDKDQLGEAMATITSMSNRRYPYGHTFFTRGIIRPLPRRLDGEDLSWYNANKIDGWNDCLSEITGEE